MFKENSNIVVWGVGQDYHKYKYKLVGIKYRLVDKNKSIQGNIIDNIEIEMPNIIHESDIDCVIVSTSKYYDEIFYELVYSYGLDENKIIRLKDIDKEILCREIGELPQISSNGPKILFGYCFLIFEQCRLHDYFLAESLRIRGAEIVPIGCGGLQTEQCSVYGGAWGNDTNDIKQRIKNHKCNCNKCMYYDRKTWEDWGKYKLQNAIDFITDEEREYAEQYINTLDIQKIKTWKWEGYEIGKWALRTFYNIHLISHKNNWSSEEEEEIKNLAYNILLMCIASIRIVEQNNPDIIYSNDSFYYPYCILQEIARKKGIPFYNAYGFRKNTYSYAVNCPTVTMPLDSAWKSFSKYHFKDAEQQFIDNYVKNRYKGTDMMINTAVPYNNSENKGIYGKIDKRKKTALLATNVTWDAAALDKGVVYDNIVDWVLHTVSCFENISDWQLIVKSHPAEINKLIPEANERIYKIILDYYNGKLPHNIILIDGDSSLSVYDLFGFIDLGIVYTTTVGLEMCCNGIPVITVANAPYRNKGFTFDANNETEYLQIIAQLVEDLPSTAERKNIEEQAKKYFFLYYFIYMIHNPFFLFTYEEGAELIIKNPEDIKLGKNEMWDYICDSILNKKEILSEDRMPPYLLEI